MTLGNGPHNTREEISTVQSVHITDNNSTSGSTAGPVATLRTIFVFMQGHLVLELDRRGCRQLSTQQTRFRQPCSPDEARPTPDTRSTR